MCGCTTVSDRGQSRLSDRYVSGHHVPVELFEPGSMIRVPDDMERGLSSIFNIREQPGLTQIGQDEFEIALIRLRETRRRDVERPPERVERVRPLRFAVGLVACRAEAR